LKAPLGLLIEGSFEETMKELKKIVEKEKPSKIVAVGDVVSSNMIRYGIRPQVFIVDNRIMRDPIAPIQADANETIFVKNPAGTLTEEARESIQKALDKEEYLIRVMIDGEEDLLTLAAVVHAPENSLVVYGQPREGVVAVMTTKEKKDEVMKIIEAMDSVA
jgi:uncharacterized protein (UPF0218 family)